MAELQTLWFMGAGECVYESLHSGELYKRFIHDTWRELTESTKVEWKFDILLINKFGCSKNHKTQLFSWRYGPISEGKLKKLWAGEKILYRFGRKVIKSLWSFENNQALGTFFP